MKKRIISILLSIIMLLGMLPVTALPAFAEGETVKVIFILNYDGAPASAPLIIEKGSSIHEENVLVPTRSGYFFGGWYTTSECVGEPFDFSVPIDSDYLTLYAKWVLGTYMRYDAEPNMFIAKNLPTGTVEYAGLEGEERTFLNEGWYFVGGRMTVEDSITVNGEVNLVLGDNCVFKAKKGIVVPENSTLTVFTQLSDTGKLIVTKPDDDYCGIGGEGNIIINGGDLDVKGGVGAPGIGGTGDVSINGGTVKAVGGEFVFRIGNSGAGIGGRAKQHAGKITITGGNITAKASEEGGAGIGGGRFAEHDGIYISGGTINATAANGCGIGGGYQAVGGYVEISGGTITASSGFEGAGIGGNNILISGGNISATAYGRNPAIGCTSFGHPTCTVTITGGKIRANGGGVAIGTEESGNTINISGGEIEAYCGKDGSEAIGGDNVTSHGPSEINITVPDGKAFFAVDSGKMILSAEKQNAAIYGKLKGKKTVIAKFADLNDVRNVTFEENDGGTCSAVSTFGLEGHRVNVTTKANKGYIFHHYETVSGDSSMLKNVFIFGKEDTVIKPVFVKNREITYINENGEEKSQSVYLPVDASADTLEDGWYVVTANTFIEKRIVIKGNVNLIIPDDTYLFAPLGIQVAEADSLTIYGQKKSNGELFINNTAANNAGIGGNNKENAGNITINGGNINVTGGSGAYGIGGGKGSTSGKTYTQNGGTVISVNGFTDEHTHTYSDKYSSNDLFHWYASNCEHSVISDFAPHTFGEGVASGNNITYTCTACGYVKSVEDEAAKALAEAKTAAKAVIDNAVKNADNDIKNYAETAKGDIDKLTTITAVTEKLEAALAEINNMKTAKAITAALAELEKAASGAVANKSKAIANAAKSLIENAESADEANAILAETLNKIASEEKTLADAKTAAKSAIDTAAGSNQSAAMQAIVSEAKGNIDNAKTVQEVEAAKQEGLARIEAQKQAEKPTDPTEPTNPDVCSRCGHSHSNGFFGQIICFFYRVINWFMSIFG